MADLDRTEAMDIHLMGRREVVVELLDGTCEPHPSLYASDEELVDVLAHVVCRGGEVRGRG